MFEKSKLRIKSCLLHLPSEKEAIWVQNSLKPLFCVALRFAATCTTVILSIVIFDVCDSSYSTVFLQFFLNKLHLLFMLIMSSLVFPCNRLGIDCLSLQAENSSCTTTKLKKNFFDIKFR